MARTWRTSDGKDIPVTELSDDHLANAIAWCERHDLIVRDWGIRRHRLPVTRALRLPLAYVYEPYAWLIHEQARRRYVSGQQQQ